MHESAYWWKHTQKTAAYFDKQIKGEAVSKEVSMFLLPNMECLCHIKIGFVVWIDLVKESAVSPRRQCYEPSIKSRRWPCFDVLPLRLPEVWVTHSDGWVHKIRLQVCLCPDFRAPGSSPLAWNPNCYASPSGNNPGTCHKSPHRTLFQTSCLPFPLACIPFWFPHCPTKSVKYPNKIKQMFNFYCTLPRPIGVFIHAGCWQMESLNWPHKGSELRRRWNRILSLCYWVK